jgi:hypothetical protein
MQGSEQRYRGSSQRGWRWISRKPSWFWAVHCPATARGHVSPESFTHDFSAQLVEWFKRGLANGEIAQCNTFGER